MKKVKLNKNKNKNINKSGRRVSVTRYYEINESLGTVKKIILEDLKHYFYTEVLETCFIIQPSKYSSDKFRAKQLDNTYAIFVKKEPSEEYLLTDESVNISSESTSLISENTSGYIEIETEEEKEEMKNYIFSISIENRYPIELKEEETEIESMKKILDDIDFIFSYFKRKEQEEREYFF